MRRSRRPYSESKSQRMMEEGAQSIAVGLYRRGRSSVLRAYSLVQVVPPSDVLHREPPSVVTTPCNASLKRMETIVPVSTAGEASTSLLQSCPPSREWNSAPPLPPAHTLPPTTKTT